MAVAGGEEGVLAVVDHLSLLVENEGSVLIIKAFVAEDAHRGGVLRQEVEQAIFGEVS